MLVKSRDVSKTISSLSLSHTIAILSQELSLIHFLFPHHLCSLPLIPSLPPMPSPLLLPFSPIGRAPCCLRSSCLPIHRRRSHVVIGGPTKLRFSLILWRHSIESPATSVFNVMHKFARGSILKQFAGH